MNKKLTHDELKSTKNAAGSFIYIYSKRVYIASIRVLF